MLSPFRPRHPRLLGAAIASAIVALAVIACRAPVPESVLPPSASKSPAAVPPESATPKVEAATLIKTDTFTTTCARTPNNRCRISGTIVAVTKHSDMLSLATLQRLSGLDQVRVDTVFKQCGPQYVCQAAKERLDTFIVLHPKSSEPGGIIRLDQKLHAEDFEEPSRPVGHAQRAEVGTDSLACKAKAPRVLAEWLGAKKVALWTRCGGGVKADSAGGA